MSRAEDQLATALQVQLLAPYVVHPNVAWLTKKPGDEPRDGEADFVVAHPDLGIMVIEVKGGGIRRVSGEWESVDRHGTAHRIKDPFRQVTGEMHSLKRIAEARPDWPAHSVRFCRADAFPDTRYTEALTPDGPPEIVIDADDLDRLEDRIREIFDWWSGHTEPEYRGGAPGAIGLESPVVVLAEIDSRITPADLAGLLYVGATRARTHLVVIGSEGALPVP